MYDLFLLSHVLIRRPAINAGVSVFVSLCLLLFGLALPGQAAVDSEAYVGQPFGVGRVTIDVLRGQPVLPLSDERFTVLEANGRVMYPALKQEPVRRLLRDLLEMDAPRKVTLYYLFQGHEPFDISPFTPHEQGVRVKPQFDADRHHDLLIDWWEQTTRYYEVLLKDRAYPPVAENFLIATLARRLGLSMPKHRSGLLTRLLRGSQTENSEAESALSYLVVGEAQQLRIDREMLSEQSGELLELQSLVDPVDWSDSKPADDAVEQEIEATAVEPLAAHVPAECFYVRFGNFTNYLWFRDLNRKWRGDLGNMILRRGIKRGAGERIQQQLSLRESALAKVLGPQVIADAALIGLDHYLEQGAAIGIVFQAKNDFLLSADLLTQRREALAKFEDAREETLELAGHSVSLIATPEGQVRSYYAQHDGFHLVTTSRKLAERFLQAGHGDRSLAALTSFQRARRELPLERDDTMVAFVSEKYWQSLSRPQWFVENLRRLKSSRQSVLLELARYAAGCERKPGQSAEELIALDILPPGFGTRVDGSELLEAGTTNVDSLRGARGYYVPIADMEVGEVSAHEAAAYQRFADKLREPTGLLPPIAVAVYRAMSEHEENETISIDLRAQGALRQKLGKVATWLGQPAAQQIRPIAGDLFAVEAVVDFPTALMGSEGSQHHLFGALRDYRAPLVVRRGAIQPAAATPELVRGYLGAWPKPGLLTWLTGEEKAEGPEPQPVGAEMWQANQDDFLLISFQPDVVRQVLPELAVQGAERAAQVRVRLEDLTGTQLAESVNALGYLRTRETSAAGSRMMNSLANQLRVPRDQCRAVAERLVDGQFVCPLGGEYQLYAPDRGLEVWISSALPEQNRFLLTAVPEDYRLPLLNWFRGLTGDLRLDEASLSAHLEIVMLRAALP